MNSFPSLVGWLMVFTGSHGSQEFWQRKNLKQTVKKIDKETERLYQELDKLNIHVEKEKTAVYSNQNIKN